MALRGKYMFELIKNFKLIPTLFKLRTELNRVDNKLANHKALPLNCQDENVLREYVRTHNQIVSKMRLKEN